MSCIRLRRSLACSDQDHREIWLVHTRVLQLLFLWTIWLWNPFTGVSQILLQAQWSRTHNSSTTRKHSDLRVAFLESLRYSEALRSRVTIYKVQRKGYFSLVCISHFVLTGLNIKNLIKLTTPTSFASYTSSSSTRSRPRGSLPCGVVAARRWAPIYLAISIHLNFLGPSFWFKEARHLTWLYLMMYGCHCNGDKSWSSSSSGSLPQSLLDSYFCTNDHRLASRNKKSLMVIICVSWWIFCLQGLCLFWSQGWRLFRSW